MTTIRSFVNCGVPGFRKLEWSADSVSWSSATLYGWQDFKTYLAAFDTEITSTNWSLTYDPTSDRVRFVPGSGAAAIWFRFESDSMAKLFGFTAYEFAASASATKSGDFGPYGVAPLLSAEIGDPLPARRSTLRTFRHGRRYGVAFGAGTEYRVRLAVAYADRLRLQSGPLTTGKVRIGDWFEADAYDADNLDGYLDAYIVAEPRIGLLEGDVEGHLTADLDVVAPADVHDSGEAIGDDVFGSVKRGYGLNYYALIEGIPYRFCEVHPPGPNTPSGIGDSTYTISPRLVVDEAAQITTKLDRRKGVAAAAELRIGIFDPENSLALFGRPTLETQITAPITYSSGWPSSITVADTTGFASSGTVYLGQEALPYASKTSTSFDGITARPFGPGYAYGTTTTQRFRTVADRPIAWNGRAVRIFAQLLDPFGASVDSAWDGDHVRQVYAGEVESLPGYDAGVWSLQTRDLIRRVATAKIGSNATAKLSPSMDLSSPAMADTTEIGTKVNGSDILVYTGANESLSCTFSGLEKDNGTPFQYSGTVDISAIQGKWTTYREAVQLVLSEVQNVANPDYGTADEVFSNATIGGVFSVGLYPTDPIAVLDDGSVRIQILAQWEALIADATNFKVTVGGSGVGGSNPYWWSLPVLVYDSEPYAYADPKIRDTGLSGKTCDAFAIRQGLDGAIEGSFPSSGFVVVEGQNDEYELIRYEAVQQVTSTVTLLRTLTRAVAGASVNVFEPAGKVQSAAVSTGTPGVIAARLISSGFPDRGSGTDLGEGFGHALLEADFVHYSGSSSSLAGGASLVDNVTIALGKPTTVEHLLGGIFSAHERSLGWVRSGTALKIGQCATYPGGTGKPAYTIRDGDLLLDNPVEITRIAPGPNIITVRRETAFGEESGDSFAYRIIEDIAARGGQSATFDLVGVPPGDFMTLAASLVMKIANGALAEYAVRLRVGGARDFLAGQLVRINVSHRGLWDFAADAPGLDALGRILEVRRKIGSLECELTVLISGPSASFALCPVALVTSSSGADLTVDDASIFAKDDPCKVYTPGDAGSEEERRISSIAGNVITLDGTPGTCVDNVTILTYASDDNANITTEMAAFAHVSDEGRWL